MEKKNQDYFFPKISYLWIKAIQLLGVLLIIFNSSNIHHFTLIRSDMCGDK